MGEILGIGCTHRPLMLGPDETWTRFIKMALQDPDMPDEWKDSSRWPVEMLEELGKDFGLSSAGKARKVFKQRFAETRKIIDEFDPDVIIIWGDDQYENFQEDLIPPFAILAYQDQEILPWRDSNQLENPWSEKEDFSYNVYGHQEAGKYLTEELIKDGFDMSYGYKPLHHPLGHSFKNTILLLDDDRYGFKYPILPFHVNCYGRRVNFARGLRLPLSMRENLVNLDPPSPNPSRCMEVGAATAKIMAKSPYKTVLMASSSWSHSFLTEKNYQLWPDVQADKTLYKALKVGDYDLWRNYQTEEIEDSGQHELLNWFCLMGAMEALNRKPSKSSFIETYAFVSCAVFAEYSL